LAANCLRIAADEGRYQTHDTLRFGSHASHSARPALDRRELHSVIEMNDPRSSAEGDSRGSLEVDDFQLNASCPLVFPNERRSAPEFTVAGLLHRIGAGKPNRGNLFLTIAARRAVPPARSAGCSLTSGQDRSKLPPCFRELLMSA
jgi:hypothetical protein